ncbi:hypothetical protein [Desertimonas flava]|uniref:hypothetical protein n=1 Tax=Desertimonas flava TaxID=2064846 RepID=UPI000E352199|nr:hypothetical protein [Desertimonas flava]
MSDVPAGCWPVEFPIVARIGTPTVDNRLVTVPPIVDVPVPILHGTEQVGVITAVAAMPDGLAAIRWFTTPAWDGLVPCLDAEGGEWVIVGDMHELRGDWRLAAVTMCPVAEAPWPDLDVIVGDQVPA